MKYWRSRHGPKSAVEAGFPSALKSKTTVPTRRGFLSSIRRFTCALMCLTASDVIGLGTVTNIPSVFCPRAGAADESDQTSTHTSEATVLRTGIDDIVARSFGGWCVRQSLCADYNGPANGGKTTFRPPPHSRRTRVATTA